MKSIVEKGCSVRYGEFRNDDTMTEKVPEPLKSLVLTYLNKPDAGEAADTAMLDPVTGKCYDHTNIIRSADGFEWSSMVVYAFKKYDIKLSREFMDFMKTKFKG